MDAAETSASSIRRSAVGLSTPYEAPRGELEAQIAAIFAEVFGVDRVGVKDDFFELGGDSLLAETLGMAILQRTSHNFELSWLVDHGSPREIAGLLGDKPADAQSPFPALEESAPPTIFIVPGKFGYTLLGPDFRRGFLPTQRLRMFELPGLRGNEPPFTRIEEIAAAYVSQLNEEHSTGPVFLSAFCQGGLIALEMAAQLADMGRPVRHLVLLDPGVPTRTVRNYRRRAGLNGHSLLAPANLRLWVRSNLESAGNLILLGRWTDGSRDEDFADEKLRRFREKKLKFKFALRRLRRKHDPVGRYKLSIDAQSKLLVAYHSYLPRRFDGPATILCSAQFRHKYEDAASIWRELLPVLQVQLVAEQHGDLNYTAGCGVAQQMQSIFGTAARDA